MDAQKKKLVLAVLGIAVLGAGYFFVFADSSSDQKQAPTVGVATRKASTKAAAPAATRKVNPNAGQPKEEPVAAERKEREEADTSTAERKKKRSDKKDEKVKKVAPAA